MWRQDFLWGLWNGFTAWVVPSGLTDSGDMALSRVRVRRYSRW